MLSCVWCKVVMQFHSDSLLTPYTPLLSLLMGWGQRKQTLWRIVLPFVSAAPFHRWGMDLWLRVACVWKVWLQKCCTHFVKTSSSVARAICTWGSLWSAVWQWQRSVGVVWYLYAGWSSASACIWASHARQVKVMTQTKWDTLVLWVGGWAWGSLVLWVGGWAWG
jgi:hypothetical protein